MRYADVLAAVAGHASLAGTEVLALNPQSLSDVADDLGRLGQAHRQWPRPGGGKRNGRSASPRWNRQWKISIPRPDHGWR